MTSEEALQILHIKPADPAAWDQLARSLYPPLLAYVASLLLTFRVDSGETAFDIVQDVLLSFYSRWSSSKARFANEAELQAYLRRSCHNLLIDRYRHKRHAERLIDFLRRKYDHNATHLSGSEEAILTAEIIKLLPDDCALIFQLYIKQNLSLVEIANQLGMAPSAFYYRWHRCLREAREIFAQEQRKGNLKRS